MCLSEGVSLYLLVHGPNLVVSCLLFIFCKRRIENFWFMLLRRILDKKILDELLILNSFGPRSQWFFCLVIDVKR